MFKKAWKWFTGKKTTILAALYFSLQIAMKIKPDLLGQYEEITEEVLAYLMFGTISHTASRNDKVKKAINNAKSVLKK